MALFARIREDIDSVLERDPAARSRLEVFLCYPGLWAVWIHRVSHWLWGCAAAAAGAAALAGGPLLHRRRYSSRRAAGPAALHRPRDRRGDRRDRDRGQRRDHVPGRDAGRHRQGPRQAPSDALRRGFCRQQRQPAGQHHHRRKFARGRGVGGALRRAAQLDGGGRSGAHRLSQRRAGADYRSARHQGPALGFADCARRRAWKSWKNAWAASRRPAEQFTAEAAEREAYREKLERLRQYVSMGEGI